MAESPLRHLHALAARPVPALAVRAHAVGIGHPTLAHLPDAAARERKQRTYGGVYRAYIGRTWGVYEVFRGVIRCVYGVCTCITGV